VKFKYPIVLVEWIDASSRSGWMSMEDALNCTVPLVYQIGFMIKKDEEKVVLISAWGPHKDDTDVEIADRHQIPRCMIKRITKLR